jgi:hypothetical protein
MGMDIYSEHGVVFEVSDLALRLFGKLKKPLVATIKDKLKSFLTINNKDNMFDGSLAKLAGVKTGQHLGDWFAVFCDDQLDGDDDDRYFKTDEHMLCVWDEITCTAELDLPEVGFRYWTRGRLNGWDVPAAGKRLAKRLKLKEIEQVTWTEMSV